MSNMIRLGYLLLLFTIISGFSFLFFKGSNIAAIIDLSPQILFLIMYYYLFFIFIRTFFHLMLSFLDYLFTKRLPAPEYHPLVSIIVPCYNEEIGLPIAIESLLNLNYPNKEIIIVDDGSKDSTLDIGIELSHTHQSIRLINQANSGKASALNHGISEANGDYVMCIDSDSSLSPNCLMMAMKYFQHYPNLAALAGGVHVATTKKMIVWFQSLEYIIALNFYKSAQSFLNVVPIVPGPIGIFKKKSIEKVGGYKTNTFAEDAELSMRLLMAGYDIKYCSAITALTEAPSSMNQLLTQRYRWSRGIIQAILYNIKKFKTHPRKFRASLILTYMFTETLIIPTVNFLFAIITLQQALIYDVQVVLGSFFIGLTLLDLTLSFYSIVMEKRVGLLFLLSIINRITYGLALEIIRFLSLIDEIFRIPMTWGSLIRKGIKR